MSRSGPALGTAIQPQIKTKGKDSIAVKEGFSWSWLGLAQIFVEGGHITKGTVTGNTQLLEYYEVNGYPGIADHVLCQEIGHVLGLDHNRDGTTGGSPDNTCMNDRGHLGQYTSPNSHDADQLNLIYDSHLLGEGASEGGTDGSTGGPSCDKNPNHRNCQPTNGRSGNGVWITVHVFPVPTS